MIGQAFLLIDAFCPWHLFFIVRIFCMISSHLIGYRKNEWKIAQEIRKFEGRKRGNAFMVNTSPPFRWSSLDRLALTGPYRRNPRNTICRFTWAAWSACPPVHPVCHQESSSRRLFDFSTLIDIRIGSIASETIMRVFIRLARLGPVASGEERRPIRHNYAPSARIMPPHLSIAKRDDGMRKRK